MHVDAITATSRNARILGRVVSMAILLLLFSWCAANARQQHRTYTRRNRQEYQSVPIPRGYPSYAEPQTYNNQDPLPLFLFPWQTSEALPQFKAEHPEGNWDAPGETVKAPKSAYDFDAWAVHSGLKGSDVSAAQGAAPSTTPAAGAQREGNLRPFVDPDLLNEYVEWPSVGCRNCVFAR